MLDQKLLSRYTESETPEIRKEKDSVTLFHFEPQAYASTDLRLKNCLVEQASIDVRTWRVSYVFKLIINPKVADRSMKTAFYELLKSYEVIS